jgi:S-adenosylmethionine/arginine decarboxylase-like enzyme
MWGTSAHYDISQARDHLELFMGDEIHRELARETLKAFINELIVEIDMEAYGPPLIEHFGKDGAKGWSIVQLITTSCVTLHTCDSSRDMYLDLFSCKRFDAERVKRFIQLWFSPRKIKYINLGRDAPK